MNIQRPRHITAIEQLLDEFPVVAVLGPRQVGKTTIARMIAEGHKAPIHWFDLEIPRDLRRIDDPMLGLEDLRGLVVIDEIQRSPELFPVLRVLVDRAGLATRFLILGSASPALLRQSSESLAGRIAYHELTGFNLDEVGVENANKLWLRGGFPRSYLASSDAASFRWRQQFVRTFLERDLPQLGIGVPSATLRRFWTMLCHYHGQIWNASVLAQAFGVSSPTVRRYLDTLISTYVLRHLPSWFENFAKRQVKAPKVYVRDSGLLHMLLGIRSNEELTGHPKVGASWEGFAMEEVLASMKVESENCYFWATHGGAELDLMIVQGVSRKGYEFKHSSGPRRSRSMGVAMESLKLRDLSVIYPGNLRYRLGERIEAVPLEAVWRGGEGSQVSARDS